MEAEPCPTRVGVDYCRMTVKGKDQDSEGGFVVLTGVDRDCGDGGDDNGTSSGKLRKTESHGGASYSLLAADRITLGMEVKWVARLILSSWFTFMKSWVTRAVAGAFLFLGLSSLPLG